MQNIPDNPMRVGDEDYGVDHGSRYEEDPDRAYDDWCSKVLAKDRAKIAEILKENIFSAEDLINKLTDYAWQIRRYPND